MLCCVVSRLTEQKGIDLIVAAAAEMIANGAQLAVLGTGDRYLQDALTKMIADGSGSKQSIAVKIGYDDALAHRLIAGSDVLLMPSRFEPCGLTQMYAMRYGTLPLVFKTGGLADSVVDSSDPSGGTGFVFETLTIKDLVITAQRAINLYRKPKSWQKAQRNAMTQDLSWKQAARTYIELYERTLITETKKIEL
jgi:starch synthase